MSRLGFGVIGLALISCGAGGLIPTGPTTAKQTYTASEVTRFAGLMKVDVRAEFTSKMEFYGCEDYERDPARCHSFGWYKGGIATFYIPDVEEAEVRYLSDAACHEVAHALYPTHNSQHWCACKKLGATPTYDIPGFPNGIVCR